MACRIYAHNWGTVSRGPGVIKKWICATCGMHAVRDDHGNTFFHDGNGNELAHGDDKPVDMQVIEVDFSD